MDLPSRKSMETSHHAGDIEKLAELIKDSRIAMLTTVDQTGELRSRPMGTMSVEFDGDLWFFTKEHSPKVSEIMRDNKVNVSYCDTGSQNFVSITGDAELITDKAKMAELWTPILKAWFPDGLEDPELSLLKITVTKAEYWDAPSSKIVQMIGFAKAAVTGKPYDAGEHGKIELR